MEARYPRQPSVHPETLRSKARMAGIKLSPLAQLDVTFYRRLKRLSAEDRAVLEVAMRIRYNEDRRKILEGGQ